jgi:hypothetical protein
VIEYEKSGDVSIACMTCFWMLGASADLADDLLGDFGIGS